MAPHFGASRMETESCFSLRRPDPVLSDALPRVTVSESKETELKYLIPPELAQGIIRGRESIRIEQHYFQRKAVLKLVKRFGLHERVDSADDFTVARVRRIELPSGLVSHLLQFKSPKEELEGAPITRRELEVPIGPATFLRLKMGATAGSLVKRRYELDGLVLGESVTPVILQVDAVQQAGRPLRRPSRLLCTGDIEVKDPTLIRPIRLGLHTFPFLESCLELSAISTNLSNRRIARRGLDFEQRRTFDKLIEEVRTSRPS